MRGVALERESTDYEYAHVYITNCVFRDFAGVQNGSALWSNGGEMVISDSTFSGNYARGSIGAGGGAIFAGGSTVTITDTSFLNNTASHMGGAIAMNGTNQADTGSEHHDDFKIDGWLTCKRCTFSGNRALGVDSLYAKGGAIYGAESVSMTVTDSTFSSNSAGGGRGGGIFSEGIDNLLLKDTTFTGDSASDGDVSMRNTALKLDGTTISNFTSTIDGTQSSGCDAVAYQGSQVSVVVVGSNANDTSCGKLQDDIEEAKKAAENNDDGADDDAAAGRSDGGSGGGGSNGLMIGGICAAVGAAILLAFCGKSWHNNKKQKARDAAIAAKANLPNAGATVVVQAHPI
ncbi:unnamed protein product [Phaeothamnion confervicola]